MARVYEDKVEPARPARTLKLCVGRSCDLCGTRAARGSHWDAGSYVVDDTEVTVAIEHSSGHSFPEGGSGTVFEVDLCPKCFKDRLIPWLRSQGAKIEPQEWDW